MIKLLRYTRVASDSILANKMRSLLTMLGLIIGVASVLTTIGIGRGAAQGVNSEIEGQGLNTLSIFPKISSLSDNSSLTSGDVLALSDRTIHPEIVAVAPSVTAFVNAAHGSEVIESQVTGTTASYAQVKNLKIGLGRFFLPEEEANHRKVAVLSPIAAQDLFKGSEPIGQMIRLKGEPFEVVGVIDESSSDESESYFRPIIVPIEVAQTHLVGSERYRGEYVVSGIVVQVAEQDLLRRAEYRVEETLRLRHNLSESDKNDFNILNQARLLEIAANLSNMMTALLGSIGTVSLLVGGIGIMNIMLVSVTERTSEIGLRKALGAHDQDILLQFLIEAMVLCAIGSLIGILLSYGVSLSLNSIPEFPFAIIIEAGALGLSLGVGLLCGFVFGLYPAMRATRLDPIEALRYE